MLYVMRHGQTEWNKLRLLQGHADIPLDEDGLKMAEDAREKYKDVHFDICFCSPLKRARKTADIVLSGRDIEIIEDDRLKEMCFGVYEGFPFPIETENTPVKAIFTEPENYVPVERGESFDDLFARTGEFLREVALPLVNEGKDVLIVGHGAMNLSIIAQIKGTPLKDFWCEEFDNCKLYQII